jgi:diaminopimelate decarboxylase
MLNEIATRLGVRVKIMLRIQPGIEAHTHEYIKTGQIDSKFGVAIATGQAMDTVKKALNCESLQLKGLHCHIGSQIFEIESFRHAAEVMMSFIRAIKDETGVNMMELNLGGGFGIYYKEGDIPAPISQFADIIMTAVQEKAKQYGVHVPKITVEPGRSITGTAGTTLYTVGSIKKIPGVRTYVAVDGGMGDNPRPALYQAQYEAILANKAQEELVEKVSISGKCCESGDMLIWDIILPKAQSGDILAVLSTGAYNYSMSSNYNRLPRPAVVLVQNGEADIIVKRETYEDLLRNDEMPVRLTGEGR